MTESRAAYRYALAVLPVAEEMSALDRVSEDFRFIAELAAGSKDFSGFLKSPVINAEKKKRILTELFAGRVSELVMKFIMLLASKGREGLLVEAIHQFEVLRDRRLGILHSSVRTAVPFT